MKYTKKEIRFFRAINLAAAIAGIFVIIYWNAFIGMTIVGLSLFFLFRPFTDDERANDDCSPYRFNTANTVSNSGISPDADIIRIGDTLEKCKQRFGDFFDKFQSSFGSKVFLFETPRYMIGVSFSKDGWANSVRYEHLDNQTISSSEALRLIELSTSYPDLVSGDAIVDDFSHSTGFKDVISPDSAMIMTVELIAALGN